MSVTERSANSPHRLPSIAVVFLSLLTVLSVLPPVLFPEAGASDLRTFYASVDAWQRGASPYAIGELGVNLNPPFTLLFFAPLTAVSVSTVTMFWPLLSVTLWLCVAGVVAREIAVPAHELALLTFALTGTAIDFGLGQLSSQLAVLLTGAWLADRRGRSIVAGVCLGILIAWKPFYGVFGLYLLWRRDLRAVAACAVAAVLVTAIGVGVTSLETVREWIAELRGVDWQWHLYNGSAWGVGAKLFSAQTVLRPVAWTPIAVMPVARWMTGAALAIAVVVTAVRSIAKDDLDRSYAALAVSALLLSPLGWIYYLPVAIAPLAATLWRRRTSWTWLVGALAVCPYILLIGRRYGLIGTILLGTWPFAMLFGSLLLVLAGRKTVVMGVRPGTISR